MAAWLLDYATVKDLAGPAATVIASGVAAGIAIWFGIRQASLAERQASVALDKLRADLFEKRYAIYAAAKELIAGVVSTEHIDYGKVRDLRVLIDESRFFFKPELQSFLERIDISIEAYLARETKRKYMPSDDPEWEILSTGAAEQVGVLRDLYAELPKRFEAELKFPQLTEPS